MYSHIQNQTLCSTQARKHLFLCLSFWFGVSLVHIISTFTHFPESVIILLSGWISSTVHMNHAFYFFSVDWHLGFPYFLGVEYWRHSYVSIWCTCAWKTDRQKQRNPCYRVYDECEENSDIECRWQFLFHTNWFYLDGQWKMPGKTAFLQLPAWTACCQSQALQ